MKNIRTLIKIGNLFLLMVALFFLARVHNSGLLIKETISNSEIFVSASDATAPEKEETYNYREYLPVYENGTEYNLYDLMEDYQILYFKRAECQDCKTYNSVILSRLRELDYPYLTIEVSKEPENYESGLAVQSAIIKSIGLSEVPTLAFIRNGEWITKIENEFTMAGTEIPLTCQQVFQ